MEFVVIFIIIVIIIYIFKSKSNENFYFKSPPLAYSSEICGRMCDNTNGCQSYYYDPSTRQCWMNNYHRYGDLYYPHIHNTTTWIPSRFRFGKYYGDVMGRHRPFIKNYQVVHI